MYAKAGVQCIKVHVHNVMCVQRQFKSVYVLAQGNQSLNFPPEETLDHRLSIECPSKALIRLRGCAG